MEQNSEVMRFDVVIVGGGLAGLAARHNLLKARVSTCVLEKSRGLGGRMSVRRGEGWAADLGAQFCNSNVDSWQSVLQRKPDETAQVTFVEKGKSLTRIIHKKGMSAFAKTLATFNGNLDSIYFSHKVVLIKQSETESGLWELQTECGKRFAAKSVLLTAPVPQALELIKKSNLPVAVDAMGTLESVAYAPCLTLIAELNEPVPQLEFSILKNPSPKLAGIYDQKAKGIECSSPVWIVHASPKISTEIWDLPEQDIKDILEKETASVVSLSNQKINFKKLTLHKWRYSEPLQVLKDPFVQVDFLQPSPALFLAGDSFGRSSVEGAFCSGEAAGRAMVVTFQQSHL